jgi:ribosomal protein S18 acetylase RimI-like enzyme
MTTNFAELHICFTDPEYQRRGIGSMMLQWGCDLADQLFLPSWVEASPTGNFLYRKYGYTDVDVKKGGDMAGSLMRREVKVRSIEGGAGLMRQSYHVNLSVRSTTTL